MKYPCCGQWARVKRVGVIQRRRCRRCGSVWAIRVGKGRVEAWYGPLAGQKEGSREAPAFWGKGKEVNQTEIAF